MEEIKSIPVEKNVRVSAQLEKLTESLRDWMQRPAPMKNLVKFARHAQAANRHLNDAAFGQLVADRNARQDRDPESRHQSFFDRFRAAELHGDAQQPIGRRTPAFGQELLEGLQRAGTVFPRNKFLIF